MFARSFFFLFSKRDVIYLNTMAQFLLNYKLNSWVTCVIVQMKPKLLFAKAVEFFFLRLNKIGFSFNKEFSAIFVLQKTSIILQKCSFANFVKSIKQYVLH